MVHDEQALEQISNAFRIPIEEKLNSKISVTIKNFGNCIEITNGDTFYLEEDLFIWIRLLKFKKYHIDISTIELPTSIRRHGILTKIINNLLLLDIVDRVSITGVSTPEMFAFVKKLNMKSLNNCDYSIYKNGGVG